MSTLCQPIQTAFDKTGWTTAQPSVRFNGRLWLRLPNTAKSPPGNASRAHLELDRAQVDATRRALDGLALTSIMSLPVDEPHRAVPHPCLHLP